MKIKTRTVLSYHFWKSHYAGRADAMGKQLQLNRENYTIIGVVPQRFAWMAADVYVPLACAGRLPR